MTLEEKVENCISWANSIRICRGTVESTYIDGEVRAESTVSGTQVFVNEILQEN